MPLVRGTDEPAATDDMRQILPRGVYVGDNSGVGIWAADMRKRTLEEIRAAVEHQRLIRDKWIEIALWATVLFLAMLLFGCNNGGSSNPYPGRLNPIAGQWTAYGTGTGIVTQLSNPFAIPAQPRSVNYVYTASGPLASKTITLNYSVDGDAILGSADPADSPPMTMRLFFWSNISDTGNDRWWCNPVPLVVGDSQTVGCTVSPQVSWTGVMGQSAMTNALVFQNAASNVFAVGFTFGGQSFAGHGVWTTSGTVTFKVNSFTVQ